MDWPCGKQHKETRVSQAIGGFKFECRTKKKLFSCFRKINPSLMNLLQYLGAFQIRSICDQIYYQDSRSRNQATVRKLFYSFSCKITKKNSMKQAFSSISSLISLPLPSTSTIGTGVMSIGEARWKVSGNLKNGFSISTGSDSGCDGKTPLGLWNDFKWQFSRGGSLILDNLINQVTE